jgi:hypothetical protein
MVRDRPPCVSMVSREEAGALLAQMPWKTTGNPDTPPAPDP